MLPRHSPGLIPIQPVKLALNSSSLTKIGNLSAVEGCVMCSGDNIRAKKKHPWRGFVGRDGWYDRVRSQCHSNSSFMNCCQDWSRIWNLGHQAWVQIHTGRDQNKAHRPGRQRGTEQSGAFPRWHASRDSLMPSWTIPPSQHLRHGPGRLMQCRSIL